MGFYTKRSRFGGAASRRSFSLRMLTFDFTASLISFSLMLLASMMAVLIIAGPVQAAGERPFLPPPHSKLDEWTPGQVCGITTDPYGDIYIAAFFESRIYIYSPAIGDTLSSGTLITAFDSGKSSPCNLASDSAGDIYAVSPEVNVVKFIPSPSVLPPTKDTTYSLDESVAKGKGTIDDHSSISVAIDPSTQNVYTAGLIGGEGRIFEYEPDGTLINETIGSGVSGAQYSSVSVYGANHNVYALDEAHGKIYVFNPKGNEILTTIDGTDVTDFPEGFGNLEKAHLAVDQANGDVYVENVFSHGVIDQFKAEPSSGTYVAHIGPAFGPGNSLHLSKRPAIAVDNGSLSPNNGDIYVLSSSKENTTMSLYAFGPLTLTPFDTLTVAKKGAGSGTVTSEPTGIACGQTCSHEYEENAKVILTAAPGPGSELVGWKGCDTEPAANKCAVKMIKAKSVTATFSVVQRTLTVVKSSESSRSWRDTVTSTPAGIQCGAVCSHAYNQNIGITLIASAATGSVFEGWSGGNCAGAGACRVTLSADMTVTAIFSAAPTSTPPIFSIVEHPLTVPNLGAAVLSGPRFVTVSDGQALLKLACSGSGSTCSGKLKLTARIKRGKKAVNTIIGQASCNIRPGDSQTITVRLDRVAKNLLKSGKTLLAILTGPAGLNRSVTLEINSTHHR